MPAGEAFADDGGCGDQVGEAFVAAQVRGWGGGAEVGGRGWGGGGAGDG